MEGERVKGREKEVEMEREKGGKERKDGRRDATYQAKLVPHTQDSSWCALVLDTRGSLL